MSLLLNSGSNKKFYTRAQDETIVRMKNEGKSNREISKAVGHSELSIQYRLGRVLRGKDSFDEINYKSQEEAATVVEAPATVEA